VWVSLGEYSSKNTIYTASQVRVVHVDVAWFGMSLLWNTYTSLLYRFHLTSMHTHVHACAHEHPHPLTQHTHARTHTHTNTQSHAHTHKHTHRLFTASAARATARREGTSARGAWGEGGVASATTSLPSEAGSLRQRRALLAAGLTSSLRLPASPDGVSKAAGVCGCMYVWEGGEGAAGLALLRLPASPDGVCKAAGV